MARRLVPLQQVREMHEQGMTGAQIAEDLGFTDAAICKALKKMGIAVTAQVTKHAPVFAEKGISALEQLGKINTYANEILDLLMRWNRGDEEALQILETQMRKVRVGKTEEFIKKYKFKDPRELALKAMLEIRGQLNLQLDIYRTLYDLKAMKDFQEEVLQAIGEVAPDVRERIISGFQKRRAIHAAFDFDQSRV